MTKDEAMTKNKHTPGPWRVVRANPSPTTGEWLIAGAMPGYLAEVRDCGSGDVAANARLIAAAPAMYALLAMMSKNGDNAARQIIESIGNEEV